MYKDYKKELTSLDLILNPFTFLFGKNSAPEIARMYARDRKLEKQIELMNLLEKSGVNIDIDTKYETNRMKREAISIGFERSWINR